MHQEDVAEPDIVTMMPTDVIGFARMFLGAAGENNVIQDIVKARCVQATGRDGADVGGMLDLILNANRGLTDQLTASLNRLDEVFTGSVTKLSTAVSRLTGIDSEVAARLRTIAGDLLTTAGGGSSRLNRYEPLATDASPVYIYRPATEIYETIDNSRSNIDFTPYSHLRRFAGAAGFDQLVPGKGNLAETFVVDQIGQVKAWLKNNLEIDINLVVRAFAGNWQVLRSCERGLPVVETGLTSMSTNLGHGTDLLRKGWTGAAASAAQSYFTAMATEISTPVGRLSKVAEEYEKTLGRLTNVARLISLQLDGIITATLVALTIAPVPDDMTNLDDWLKALGSARRGKPTDHRTWLIAVNLLDWVMKQWNLQVMPLYSHAIQRTAQCVGRVAAHTIELEAWQKRMNGYLGSDRDPALQRHGR